MRGWFDGFPFIKSIRFWDGVKELEWTTGWWDSKLSKFSLKSIRSLVEWPAFYEDDDSIPKSNRSEWACI